MYTELNNIETARKKRTTFIQKKHKSDSESSAPRLLESRNVSILYAQQLMRCGDISPSEHRSRATQGNVVWPGTALLNYGTVLLLRSRANTDVELQRESRVHTKYGRDE